MTDNCGSLGGRHSKSVPASSIPFGFFLLALLFNPWNSALMSSFRANDLFLLASLLTIIPLKRVSGVFLLLWYIWMVILLVSLTRSSLVSYPHDLSRLAFFYKYSLIFFVPLVFLALVDRVSRLRLVEVFVFVTFVFLIAWAYFYPIAINRGVLIGVSRASFPGPASFEISDAHLYSNYLAVSLLYYMIYYQKIRRHSAFLTFAVVLSALGALVLTGSRNGFVVLGLGGVVWFLFVGSFRSRVSKGVAFRVLALVVVSAMLSIAFWEQISDFLGGAAARAFNFSFGSDASAQNRLVLLGVAVDDMIHSSVLFGASLIGASVLWYDSGFGILLAHSGFAGVIYIVFLLLLFFLLYFPLRLRIEYRTSLVLFIVYAFSNMITEFALVTRSVLPSIVCIMIPLVSANLRKKVVK
ncbi:hypothetical protein [Maritimibacter sp. HL-12]|uniref:hypothetical protein n=1 Tax=Maritimibacter sp. HL-12 TaxID=1162418 RepID=UPI000A0F029A|nr:hypothetical protein [Maritimibacter sp. HL-12]SMH56173.1 hypothetical protein SAMN05661107_3212 [Maritimibacter sp. HL-12]